MAREPELALAPLDVNVITQSVVIFGLHKRVEGTPVVEHKNTEPTNRIAVTQDNDDGQIGALLPPVQPFDDDFFGREKDDWYPFKKMHSMHDRINQMFGSCFAIFVAQD